MSAMYIRLSQAELEALRLEAKHDRRPPQDEAAVLIAEALGARRAKDPVFEREDASAALAS